jgi:DNA-binding beta-propeller fold protein YncE
MSENCAKCGSRVVGHDRVCAQCGEPLGSEPRPEPTTIFYSYSHKDEKLRRRLETNLAVLRRSGFIREWHDRKIIAGQDWDKEISKHLESAELILFLISPDFISSSYISDIEVKRALERQNAGDAVIVPVILRPAMWRIIPEFSRLQALPEDARPVTEWPSRDRAFLSISEGILVFALSRASIAFRKPVATRVANSHHPARRRIFDAALPARVQLRKPSALLVMMRRTDSPGLRAIVEADPHFDLSEKDIGSHPITLKFPADKDGTPQSLDLTIKVESPQFKPKSQIKNIKVPPRGDSDCRIFLLTPAEIGSLVVNVEISYRSEIIAGCVLRTVGGRGRTGAADVSHSIASAPLPLAGVDEETEKNEMAVIGSGQLGKSVRERLTHDPVVEIYDIDPLDSVPSDSVRNHQWLRSGPLYGFHMFKVRGHSARISGVAVTPDGKRVVSASDDNTLKIWDLASGRELRTLTGHTWGVTAVAVTPDGKRVVSASDDNTLKIWDLASGRELRTLTGHTGCVGAMALTPDGKRVVSGSDDDRLKIWDLASGHELRTYAGHLHPKAVAVTPDGQRAVSAEGAELKVWELGSGRGLRTLTGHTDWVLAVAITQDGQRAISACIDGTLKVWDLGSGRELRTLSGHGQRVLAVAVTPDGQGAISGSYDNTLKVWDLDTGRLLATLNPGGTPHCFVISEAARLIITGD